MNKIVILGANGQLGQCLQDELSQTNTAYVALDRSQCDISQSDDLERHLANASIVINCAAYTAVDAAEKDEGTANKINATAVKLIADLCEQNDTPFIHISTDYVFNGEKNSPYQTDDITQPINAYGRTKLIGEEYALNYSNAIVIRTSWVFSEYGKNFVKTMLALSKNRNELNIVADQLGKPTYARDLARAILKIAESTKNKPLSELSNKVYHFSNEEQTSWSDFAREIFSQSLERKLIANEVKVNDIPSSEYPTPAARPMYSVLDNSGIYDTFNIEAKAWNIALREMLDRCDPE